MVTPSKIQALSDNIESIYQHMVDELLINIGRHITSPTWTHTASWEIQKLAELGQLTQENAAIINGWIKQMPPAIRQTMEATRAAALDQLEKQLEQAAKDGYITPAVTDRTVQILRDYQEQAASVYNMVNTTMLQSSVDQYARAVNLTEAEYGKLLAQREATNAILDEAAGNIAMGAETRQQAVRRAILKISDEGLTGFIDKAGRSWTPEAYVNMVTRTTVHNVAIQSTKARMQDYNTQVFQVSSHAAARPLCYPYQGKFYSWDNTAGEIELGNGSSVRYEPLNSTTYGQAAGLFGINCGHFPIPIIPGVTIPHGADNIQPKEENEREYKESQEQRAIEREIREAKRNVEMLGDAATKEDKQKVRELQAKMREFTDRTGRARRYDRESIVTAKQAAKANPPEKVEAPVVKPVVVGDVLKNSLGNDADEFKELLEKADPRVGATYTAYSADLKTVTQKPAAGVYYSGSKRLEYSLGYKGKSKYQVLGHEYGHHVDAEHKTGYTSSEIETIDKHVKHAYSFLRVFERVPSSSDEFLGAMRRDRAKLSVYNTDPEERRKMRDELIGSKLQTTGIQDAFDGFWGTRSSKDWGYYLPWGHGEKYYNRNYNSIKDQGLEKELKAAYKELGFDASNQAKVKTLTRDYETASELWANIQAAKTVGGEELRLMTKYFPEAVKAWEDILGGLL